MQIIMIAFRTRQGGRLPQALLSAGSTWHARPLAASVCTVVPAAAVATGSQQDVCASHAASYSPTPTRDSGQASPTKPYAARL